LASEGNKVCAVRVIAFVGLYFWDHALVELAHASPVRVALHHVLAGIRPSGSEQDLVRRISRRTAATLVLETENDEALGENDSRRTGEIQHRDARPMWSLWDYYRSTEGIGSWSTSNSGSPFQAIFVEEESSCYM
jgi:hypothetical protein